MNREDKIGAIVNEGYEDYQNGRRRDQCPYRKGVKNKDPAVVRQAINLRTDWLLGWDKAERENKEVCGT